MTNQMQLLPPEPDVSGSQAEIPPIPPKPEKAEKLEFWLEFPKTWRRVGIVES